MEAEKETLNITVLIAGRPYPLKIEASEEGDIRKVVKTINEKINKFQSTYTYKDKQDCLAMTLLTYAVELQKNAKEVTENKELSDSLDQIDELLTNILKKKD